MSIMKRMIYHEKIFKKIPIRDRIYNEIKADIMKGKYEPGDRLSITSISKTMKVSNSPVREAISMLNRDGLVDIFPKFRTAGH